MPLGPALEARYGGPLAFPIPRERPYVIANFVSTIDGVVSFALPGGSDAGKISAGNPADRFVLALLRACADAVIVGAGTLREEGAHLWTPEHVFPDEASAFAALRLARKRQARAHTVFVTASGDIDLGAPAFATGNDVLVITTARGKDHLANAPGHVRVRAASGQRPSGAEIVRIAQEETGGRLILTEGGPRLLAEFVRARALDELFLTIAPQLAGRSKDERRLALIEEAAFAPEDAPWWRLRSVKRADDYLFLRFASSESR